MCSKLFFFFIQGCVDDFFYYFCLQISTLRHYGFPYDSLVIIRVSVMFAPLQVLKLYEATYTPYFQNKNNN